MSPKKIVNDLGDLMKLIPKWLRVSAVVIVASAASIFALGGFISDVVQATTQVPVIQKDLNDCKFQSKIEISAMQMNVQQEIEKAYREFQSTVEAYNEDNQKDHLSIKTDIVELKTNIRQIDKKSDQILSAIINSKTNDAIRNRVVK